MSLQITHVLSFACRGRLRNLRAVCSAIDLLRNNNMTTTNRQRLISIRGKVAIKRKIWQILPKLIIFPKSFQLFFAILSCHNFVVSWNVNRQHWQSNPFWVIYQMNTQTSERKNNATSSLWIIILIQISLHIYRYCAFQWNFRSMVKKRKIWKHGNYDNCKKITSHITSKNLSAYNFAIFLPKICHKLNKQNFGMRVLPNTVGNYSWKQSSLLIHYSCCCAPSKARYFTHCSCKVGPRQVLRLPFLKHTTVYNPDNDLRWEYETIWKRSASSDMRTFSPDVRLKTLWCKVTLILLNTLKLLMSFSLQKTQISRDFRN